MPPTFLSLMFIWSSGMSFYWLWEVIFTTLGWHWEHFWCIFQALDQFEYPDDPQGPPDHSSLGPGSPKGGRFGYQKSYKIGKISTLEPVRFLNWFFHENWMTLLSKSMSFVRSSRLAERFEAFLINVCFLIGICAKMTSELLPKSTRIHTRAH